MKFGTIQGLLKGENPLPNLKPDDATTLNSQESRRAKLTMFSRCASGVA